MTQQQLADKAGVDAKTIGNLESRGKWPIARTRARIEQALGWPPGELARIAAGSQPKIVSPNARKVLRRELDDEDYRRVIGLLEGTLTWPAGETRPAAGEAQGDGRPAG